MPSVTKLRRGEAVEPKATATLMKEMGPSRASRILGVSTTTLHKAIKLGEVSRVIEVAAEGALVRHPRVPPAKLSAALVTQQGNRVPKRMYLVEVPQNASELLEKLAAAVGGTFLAA